MSRQRFEHRLRAIILLHDEPLSLNIDDNADLLRGFVQESLEHLQNIELGALILEDNPKDEATLNSIFRAFHTFKGGSGFLNLRPINRLAHDLETLLDLARQQKLAIDPGQGPTFTILLPLTLAIVDGSTPVQHRIRSGGSQPGHRHAPLGPNETSKTSREARTASAHS